MKFKFKIQDYQSNAVNSTVHVFEGQQQAGIDNQSYKRDLGKRETSLLDLDDGCGYRNSNIILKDEEILKNINESQNQWNITNSDSLSEGIGKVNLDIEMETGTGKTYVYIKTMFELNKKYGWSKFIVVVPSIAIREGVYKSFKMLEEHFMEQYGKKARYFVYNSKNLQQLDAFSSDNSIHVMIINTQAFATSLKEGGTSAESRIIYSKRDEFESRRPIDVIAANQPIIIMDEPQKMEGDVTKRALKRFNPLFVLNYSATHRTKHNTIYALDALDAYRQKLVKRIQVKGFEVKNLRGTQAYLYLDEIVLSKTEPPRARIEYEEKNKLGNIRRQTKMFSVNDNLYTESQLKAYQDFIIAEINPGNSKGTGEVGSVRFTNGEIIKIGEVYGDTNELTVQRVQIRETIASHLEKERELFKSGIKCLSLFFIDEVAKYKSYDSDGKVVKGVLQKIFEEEYQALVNQYRDLNNPEYTNYLDKYQASKVHNGYFSVDKQKRAINSDIDRKTGISKDVAAYDLILKNKERLLSFDEPTRFIFSHSALREGWDNPNIFQICTLRHTESTTAKRQEVGRGLRLCVDKDGVRMDLEKLGENVHKVNLLTVIANESYANFTDALQKETLAALRIRPLKVETSLFLNKKVKVNGKEQVINDFKANKIMTYLYDEKYVNEEGHLTEKYRKDKKDGTLAQLPKEVAELEPFVTKVLQSIDDPNAIKEITSNGLETRIPEQELNDKFACKEFQDLWKEINHKYVYTVHYDSDELVRKAVQYIDDYLQVKTLRYIRTIGNQSGSNVAEFDIEKTSTEELVAADVSSVKYDLVGDVARQAKLTRLTAAKILSAIRPDKFAMFKANPEEFIKNVSTLIKEQKATMIVDHIEYDATNETYDSTIFTSGGRAAFSRAVQTQKHITDYVVCDSIGEKDFAENLDAAEEVVVYAKLPRSFQIPTPVGNYAPDWAIALTKDKIKHIFFVAETKGTMESMELREIEKAKIDCARRLYNSINVDTVKYDMVSSFNELRDKVMRIPD